MTLERADGSDGSFPVARSAADVSRALAERWPNERTLRFLWQTDAALRCRNIGSALAEVVGTESADLGGRDMIAIAACLDEGGPFHEAISTCQTCNGVDVAWPVADAAAAVAVTIGAVAVLDQNQEFAGFHGFGLIRLDRVTERPTHGSLKS